MTTVASPFLHSQPSPKRHKDNASSSPLLPPSSPSLLSYPSPFYSSSSIFAPLQSPFLSPLPPSSSSTLFSTPTILSLTSSSHPTDLPLLPPSALKPPPSSPTPSRSHHPFYHSSFPFNAQPHPILTRHTLSAMLPTDDDSDDDHSSSSRTLPLRPASPHDDHYHGGELFDGSSDGEGEGEGSSRPSSPSSFASVSLSPLKMKRGRGKGRVGLVGKGKAKGKGSLKGKVRMGKAAGRPVKKVQSAPSSLSTGSDASVDSPCTPSSTSSGRSRGSGGSLGGGGVGVPTAMTAAELAKEQTGGSGLSCHQCKTRKQLDELYTCGNYEKKKRATGEAKKAIRPCRKKYCARSTRTRSQHDCLGMRPVDCCADAAVCVRICVCGRCLHKFYSELPPARTESGTTVLHFECPSCRLICQCAACKKRQQPQEDGQASQASSPSVSPSRVAAATPAVPTPPPPPPLPAPVAAPVLSLAPAPFKPSSVELSPPVLHPGMHPMRQEDMRRMTAVIEAQGERETDMSDGGEEDHEMDYSSSAA